jgi:peptidoglycan/xylan/chitin deacetylase (PgdA/CDA1 family)
MRDIHWRGGARCALSLGIDVDGESLWLSKDTENRRRPGVLSQGAYGPKVGVGLMLDLLERHAVRATFFVPGWIAEQYPDAVERIHRSGHEVGHHGYEHEWIRGDAPEQERDVLQRGIAALEAITGERPVGYRSPAWELSPNTLPLLRSEGFEYASNLMDDFVPYVHPEGIVELPVQWLLDDAPYFMFQTRPPSRPLAPARVALEAWTEEFHGLYRYGGLVNLTLHPQFSGRPGRLAAVEQFLAVALSYPDVWVAPLREVARYWKEEHG